MTTGSDWEVVAEPGAVLGAVMDPITGGGSGMRTPARTGSRSADG